jgi:peptidoglycan/xylan/chitin deacetylase (PgdA/CDA1 family)
MGYSASVFTQHMDFLKANGYNTITPDELLDWMESDAALPPRPILITMDDNYIAVFSEIYPILKSRGMFGVNFAHTNYVGVGGTNDHCDWNEIIAMEADGVIFTESHTKSHQNLTTLTNAAAQTEIAGSKAVIEANIPAKTCRYIAYPYGGYNATHVAMCSAAGYRAAFTTADKRAFRTTPPYEIGRTSIGSDTVASFATKIGQTALPALPPAGFTLDNADPNCTVTPSGAWISSTGGTPYGTAALVHTAGSGTDAVKWAAKLRQGGAFKVYAWWTSAPDRSTNATYQVTSAEGTVAVAVNQQSGGGQWNLLGVWNFAPGTAAQVVLTDAANGSVSADAVWFEPAPSASVGDWQLFD